MRAYDAVLRWASLRAPDSEEEVPPAFAGLDLAARRPLPAGEGIPQVNEWDACVGEWWVCLCLLCGLGVWMWVSGWVCVIEACAHHRCCVLVPNY